MSYAEFLARKVPAADVSGREPGECHPVLYPFQRSIVDWAVRRGRAAIFADCGMGKTFMQLEWARQMGARGLIVAPLAVANQTIAEAKKIGVSVRYVTQPDDAPGLSITNYERLRSFVGTSYDCIVLDESSILKSLDGKTRQMLLDSFTSIPYRLCCTATPSPNDLTELGNHAQFLGIMSFREMSAMFFVKESNGQAWRLKGYAADAFYRWLASWSVYIRRPSDLGFDDDGFVLPPLAIEDVQVHSDNTPAGRLFPGLDPGIQGRLAARRASQGARIERAAEMVRDGEQWIVWCGLNSEGRLLRSALDGVAVELVEGSQDEADKIAAADRWIRGESPPFVSLYTYTATERDIGNCRDEAVFFEHFGYVIDGLLRATMPGRLCCVHVAQIPAMLVRDGYIGMKDFRAETVRAYESRGWIYHGEVCIDKDPQAQAIRTKSKGLLFVQLKKDSSWLRPALADYILVFRKPGDNPEPVRPDVSNEEWIQWARPIWYGIRETNTLNYREARTDKDERHICPLQLDVIERCVRLWSNPGDLVCSPFAGIGSEGVVALRHRRRFVGVELKPEYYTIATKNLDAADKDALPLFAEAGS